MYKNKNPELVPEGLEEPNLFRLAYLPQINNIISECLVNDSSCGKYRLQPKTYQPFDKIVFDFGNTPLLMSSRNLCFEGTVQLPKDAPYTLELSESFHQLIKSISLTDSLGIL